MGQFFSNPPIEFAIPFSIHHFFDNILSPTDQRLLILHYNPNQIALLLPVPTLTSEMIPNNRAPDLNEVTHVDPTLRDQRLLRKRWLQAQPHLRNTNLHQLNADRIDLDSHERDFHPERFPRVHNLPQNRRLLKHIELTATPLFYQWVPDLFKAAFGIFVSGYDSLGVMGDELVFPTINGNPANISSVEHDNGGYFFSEPVILIRIGYTLVQFAQSVVGFILKAFFFPFVGSFDHSKSHI